MKRVFLMLSACLVMSMVFAPAAMAQEDLDDIRANAADTVPPNADGTCPEGFVTVNAPFCAEESPNTPGRIFGYGEGDLELLTQGAATPQATNSDAAAVQYAEDDDVTALPDTGGLPLTALAAGIAMVGLGGLLLKRRMS